MAPRRRRSKVGLRRMDAALDAMRPMGFPTDAVQKSVKKLLKVYGGDDGWAFIEEAAYKLLIETILEEPEEGDQQELETGLIPLEGGSKGSHEQPASGNELCDNEATNDGHEEPSRALEIHGSGTYCQDVKLGLVKVEKQDSGFEDVKDHKEMGVEVGSALASDPQPVDIFPTDRRCRPCYGWISDDGEDEIVEATQSSSLTVTADLAA